jgi:hypothetical protein
MSAEERDAGRVGSHCSQIGCFRDGRGCERPDCLGAIDKEWLYTLRGFKLRNNFRKRRKEMRRLGIVGILFCAFAGIAFGQSAAAPAAPAQEPAKPAAAPAAKNDYANGDNWLCRPARQDACAVDLSTTVISASGELTRENWAADPNAPVDCFYVYPTISNDPGGNSDMIPGPEEKAVVRSQFARFASKCRPYAPIYRQVTITALRAALSGAPLPVDRALAYNDVLDAWNYYLEHDNKGRGVVLIGHSQGANVLTQLIKNEIDGKPVEAHMVSAMLLGTNLPVPKGKDVGGTFLHTPLCHAASQTGCVIAYVTFRASAPPPANTRFGKAPGENMIAACTNPASLAGGSGELHAYFGTHGGFLASAETGPPAWVTPAKPMETPFVSLPGLITAECVSSDSGTYLAVSVHGDPAGPRASDIPGDLVVGGQVFRDWGLHLIDVQVAIGNLIDIVGQEAKAFTSTPAKK